MEILTNILQIKRLYWLFRTILGECEKTFSPEIIRLLMLRL